MMNERSVTMGHKCCSKQKVKRGLWSPEEDEKLIKCVAMHGHGCWTSVPKLAGLQRCGKSCRLRWINYLRPGIKRGSFSAQEERIIIEVHSILGNRWAQIAKYLPGRSDNEVKNFWNSCIKKKLIAQGLDPKTQCLMPYHQTSSRINACSLYQIQPQPTSTFTVNPQMRDASVEMNPNFITVSPLPPDTNFSHFLPLEEAMTPTIHASTNFTNRSSTDITSILLSINPSGFGFLDENCLWGPVVAPIETLSKNEMYPQQEHLEQKKNVPRINKANEEKGDQKMEASFDNPNFVLESIESTLMPGRINCSLSSMDQLAWDCQNFPFSHF